jgi:hypothetical protein
MDQQRLGSRDDFECWLANMDDVIESFLASQPEELRLQMDFGPHSLDVVESMILKTYSDTDSMLDASQSQLVNALSCYIGETFRKLLGGKWDIRLDDPKFAFAGLPILVGGANQSAPRCPLTLATSTADRRKGTYLRTILENAAAK